MEKFLKIIKKDSFFGLRNDDGTVVLPPKFYKNFVKKVKDLSFQELLKIKLVDIQFNLRPDGTYIYGKHEGELGLKNYNGEVITKCLYDSIFYPQPNGLAIVILNKKYGIVKAKGETVVKCEYDWIAAFEHGTAGFRLNFKFGLMDEKGEFVLRPTYDGMNPYFSN